MTSKDFMVICAPVGLGALDQKVSGGNTGDNDDPYNHELKAN